MRVARKIVNDFNTETRTVKEHAKLTGDWGAEYPTWKYWRLDICLWVLSTERSLKLTWNRIISKLLFGEPL